jgi:hypothetical protein
VESKRNFCALEGKLVEEVYEYEFGFHKGKVFADAAFGA